MTKLKYIFLLLCPILLQSCVTIQPPVFKQADHLAISNNLNSPEVTFDMVFQNPNNFGLTLKKIETTATVDNGTAFTYKTEEPIRINSNSEFTIPVRISMPVNDLMKALPSALNLLLGSQQVPFQLSGTITLKKFLFKKTFTFSWKG